MLLSQLEPAPLSRECLHAAIIIKRTTQCCTANSQATKHPVQSIPAQGHLVKGHSERASSSLHRLCKAKQRDATTPLSPPRKSNRPTSHNTSSSSDCIIPSHHLFAPPPTPAAYDALTTLPLIFRTLDFSSPPDLRGLTLTFCNPIIPLPLPLPDLGVFGLLDVDVDVAGAVVVVIIIILPSPLAPPPAIPSQTPRFSTSSLVSSNMASPPPTPRS